MNQISFPPLLKGQNLKTISRKMHAHSQTITISTQEDSTRLGLPCRFVVNGILFHPWAYERNSRNSLKSEFNDVCTALSVCFTNFHRRIEVQNAILYFDDILFCKIKKAISQSLIIRHRIYFNGL